MSNRPLITIITVVFNMKDFLETTIKSIISQDYENIEYIIIDGGSTDGTLNVIKEYENKIDFFKSEPDKGVYDAMNKGSFQANGEWINFMNAGDTFSSLSCVSDVVNVLQSNTDIAVGGINTVNENFEKLESKTFKGIENIFQYNPCYHQATFVCTALMQELKFDLQYAILSDYDFMFKAFTLGHKFQALNFPVADYLLGGLSEQNLTKVALEGMTILSKYSKNDEDVYKSRWYVLLNNSSQLNISSQLYQQYFVEIEKIKKRYKKIVVYGYGDLGKEIVFHLGNQVEIIVDKYCNEDNVFKPEALKDFDYDALIIAVIGREEEIKVYLVDEINVHKNKIITCLV